MLYIFFIYIFIYQSFYLFVCLSICLFVYLPICIFFYLFICLYIYLFVHLYLFIYLSTYYLPSYYPYKPNLQPPFSFFFPFQAFPFRFFNFLFLTAAPAGFLDLLTAIFYLSCSAGPAAPIAFYCGCKR